MRRWRNKAYSLIGNNWLIVYCSIHSNTINRTNPSQRWVSLVIIHIRYYPIKKISQYIFGANIWIPYANKSSRSSTTATVVVHTKRASIKNRIDFSAFWMYYVHSMRMLSAYTLQTPVIYAKQILVIELFDWWLERVVRFVDLGLYIFLSIIKRFESILIRHFIRN